MVATGDLIDFEVIEGQKENIQSIPSGRSARALANLYSVSQLQPQLTPTPSDTTNLNDANRQEFEAELSSIAESDDPLDIFDRYVKWTLDAYPSAQATKESQLLPLLERATKTFLNNTQYKNDPRYLKLWLIYIRSFSDAPRETFAFLARHNIGESLALFYEEFAAWLEGAGRWQQAEEIYNMGIQREARPAARLLRKYNEFQVRLAQQPQANEPSSPALPPVRRALGEKIDPFAAASSPANPQASRPNSGVGGGTAKSGKPKLQIFADDDAAPPAVSSGGGWDSIGSLADRRKENIVEPKSWAGETLKAGGKKSSAPKMAVFKDQSLPQFINPQTIIPKKEQVTVNPRSGRQEIIFVNLEAVYPTPDDVGTEMCFEELRAFNRGWLSKIWTSEKVTVPASAAAPKLDIFNDAHTAVKEEEVLRELKQSPVRSVAVHVEAELLQHVQKPRKKMQIFSGPEEPASKPPTQVPVSEETSTVKIMLDENGNVMKAGRSRKMKTMEVNETQIIKANLSSPSGKKKLKRKGTQEPTMTFHTKAATDEIYDLFNQPLASEAPSESEGSENEEDDDDDADETDGDYTSGGESTCTGRLGTSEAGDDTTGVRSVSEWSDFTAQKHIPDLESEVEDDTRATYLTEEADNEADDEVDALSVTQRTDVDDEDIVTPESPERFEPRTSFVPIPPEDFVAPNRPYRNAMEAAQNRLPFMTPIAEKTETSMGASTCGRANDYFNAKTPSKETKSFREIEAMMSSPLQEIVNESYTRAKIPQPALSRKKDIDLVAKAQHPDTTGPPIKDAQCNPVDDYVRVQILEALNPPLTSYDGFFDHDENISRAPEIRKYCKAVSKQSKAGADKTASVHQPPRLVFDRSDESYLVKRELGAGAFAPVYLVESTGHEEGKQYALKMEDPPTPWEFYITRTIQSRLASTREAASIITIPSFHLYSDECYLIEEYRSQGTLLDLVNLARADSTQPGGVMDEVLVMWLGIELFRAIEAMHRHGVLHGDLKGDNCLVRFEKISDDEVWSAKYSPAGANGWSRKGITLIDFGRGIDMHAFRPDVQFIADWKVGPQDCAEMRECRPWTYQIDYFGLAGILHSLLFGKYIETIPAEKTGGIAAGKVWKLKESFKRYWQGEIWAEVFDLLLNPTSKEWLSGETATCLPVLEGMGKVRERMEIWLEGNCERGLGLQGGIRRLEFLLGQRK